MSRGRSVWCCRLLSSLSDWALDIRGCSIWRIHQGGLDIQGFCRVVRTSYAHLDIILTISILHVWGHLCHRTSWHTRGSELLGRRRRYHGMI